MTYLSYQSALKLQEKEAERCSYPLRLDVYGSGCDHDCSYCYARAQMIVGGWNNSRNPKHPFPRIVDPNCLREILIDLPSKKPTCVSGNWNKLRPLLVQKFPLRIGAVTDCFQRYMESKTHTGLHLLEILTEAKYPAQIVTKSDIVADDKYIEAMKENRDNLLIQLSITSPNDVTSSRIEHGAPPTSKRLAALNRLVQEGFYTAVRINPLFPMFPDETLTKLSATTHLKGLALLQRAAENSKITMPIFSPDLPKKIIEIFEKSPPHTRNKHTIIAGFARLPFASIKLVSQAIGWKPEELKEFFRIKRGNCYYYSPTEIRLYYEAISEMCKEAKVPFSVCYDSDDNYEAFRDLWANPKDCCNAVGVVKGFEKVFKDCC